MLHHKYLPTTLILQLGWFANPIFSPKGDYPKVMKDLIAKRSKEQNYSRSRLPVFTEEEVKSIRGAYDFFGLNHYTSFITRYTDKPEEEFPVPSIPDDVSFPRYQNDSWPASAFDWLKVCLEIAISFPLPIHVQYEYEDIKFNTYFIV